MSSTTIPKVVPAHLSFLAIYNPSFGSSDDTLHEQIVFYFPKPASARSRHGGRKSSSERELRDQENEKLRQVGLAQGMVEFARSFSNGSKLNSVETHKSRIVTHELEPGWWILASIQLTQLPSASNHAKSSSDPSDSASATVEYSAREVSPPSLLLQQLICAHSVFLLHHASSLQELFVRLDRTKLHHLLDKFWTRFAVNWDVMLHGSPAVEIYGGIKLAAGGELGIGVGEEEWGSGEREVLEDHVRRTDGLVDVIVSRFGGPCGPQHDTHSHKLPIEPGLSTDVSPDRELWLGSGRPPNAVDGMVFSGVGALSRTSMRALSCWIESIYSHGDYAYGVRDNPTSDRRKRQRRQQKGSASGHVSSEIKGVNVPGVIQDPVHHQTEQHAISRPENEWTPRIPPPIVNAMETSLGKASATVDAKENTKKADSESMKMPLGDPEIWMKYLTLGYGTAWGGVRQSSPPQKESTAGNNDAPVRSGDASMRYIDPEPEVDHAEERRDKQIRQESSGYFIIGLQGDMESDQEDDINDDGNWNNRIPFRTVYVELAPDNSIGEDEEESTTPQYADHLTGKGTRKNKRTRLRPIVYIHRPFLYTFLFDPQTECLALSSFYRNLHTYFSPLHRALSNSTSPARVATRIAAASHPYTTISAVGETGLNTQPIYDLVYDPRTLTVHSNIPNIPEPGTLVAEGLAGPTEAADWSRVEALNVHAQILATVSGTRSNMPEVERTSKTSGLAEGIGIDARRYVEGLLSLNR